MLGKSLFSAAAQFSNMSRMRTWLAELRRAHGNTSQCTASELREFSLKWTEAHDSVQLTKT